MYDEKQPTHKIDWANILKKAAVFIVVILVIFGIITLITRCSRNTSKNKSNNETKVAESESRGELDSVISSMKSAILEYATSDILPKNVGEVDTVRLDYLIKENYAEPLKSDAGKTCDRTRTYGVITKQEKNYSLKIYAKCGFQKQNKTIYIGCFDGCNGTVCEGTKSESGVCTSNQGTSTNSSSSTRAGSNQTSTSSNTSTNASANTTPKTTYYEYKKYHMEYTCSNGTLNSNNQCEVTKPATYNGIVAGKGLTYSCPDGSEPQNKKCTTYEDASLQKVYDGTIWSEKSTLGSGYEKTGNTK